VPRAQRPRGGEELLAPFRVLAGGEDLATAGAALLAGAGSGRARFHPALAAAWLVPSGAAAVVMCSLFARWYLL
jgi:hypothetical protein